MQGVICVHPDISVLIYVNFTDSSGNKNRIIPALFVILHSNHSHTTDSQRTDQDGIRKMV